MLLRLHVALTGNSDRVGSDPVQVVALNGECWTVFR